MTRPMYDSVTAARLPADARLVGAYIDGRYANEAAVRARCPHATVVRITVRGTAGAHVADCETGAMSPDAAASWARAEIAAGRQPTIYCNLSTWPTVKQAVARLGLAGVSYWIAHYDGKAEMIPGAVAKQYIERKDQNLDYGIAADYWPGVDPKPVHAQAVSPSRPLEVDMKYGLFSYKGAHYLTSVFATMMVSPSQERAALALGAVWLHDLSEADAAEIVAKRGN